MAKYCGWSLAPELTIDKIRPDGVVLDEFRIRRGFWEAKGPNVNFAEEIRKKIAAGYPLTNTLFENSQRALLYSQGLTLDAIPPECFEYRLGNRSALEWVIDQYQVSLDKRSGIESDPNRLDDPQYILRLLKQVVQVSVKTVELVKELAEAVTPEDWSAESVEGSNG